MMRLNKNKQLKGKTTNRRVRAQGKAQEIDSFARSRTPEKHKGRRHNIYTKDSYAIF